MRHGIRVITDAVEKSSLFEDRALRRSILSRHFPASLMARYSLATLMQQIPRNYQKAIFSRTIARLFVYEYGVDGGHEDYRTFIEKMRKNGAKAGGSGILKRTLCPQGLPPTESGRMSA